jgi:hypothetical protein
MLSHMQLLWHLDTVDGTEVGVDRAWRQFVSCTRLSLPPTDVWHQVTHTAVTDLTRIRTAPVISLPGRYFSLPNSFPVHKIIYRNSPPDIYSFCLLSYCVFLLVMQFLRHFCVVSFSFRHLQFQTLKHTTTSAIQFPIYNSNLHLFLFPNKNTSSGRLAVRL